MSEHNDKNGEEQDINRGTAKRLTMLLVDSLSGKTTLSEATRATLRPSVEQSASKYEEPSQRWAIDNCVKSQAQPAWQASIHQGVVYGRAMPALIIW